MLCQLETYFPNLAQPESLSGIGMHHTKARVALMHLLPLTWIHLRALACIHFPNACASFFGWQTFNAAVAWNLLDKLCIAQKIALVSMLLQMRPTTEDKETQTEESFIRTFGKVGRSFNQGSKSKAMCLFTPKECIACNGSLWNLAQDKQKNCR